MIHNWEDGSMKGIDIGEFPDRTLEVADYGIKSGILAFETSGGENEEEAWALKNLTLEEVKALYEFLGNHLEKYGTP